MHLLLWAEDSEAELRAELTRIWGGGRALQPNLHFVQADFTVPAGQRLPHLAFARQWLPNAREVRAESIRNWASELFEVIRTELPEGHPWSLHVEPHYGERTPARIGARAWHSVRIGAKGKHPGDSPQQTTRQRQMEAQAGRHRSELVRSALIELLKQKRRHLLRDLRREVAPFTEHDSLVQLLLTAPDTGFLSVAAAPLPFVQRHLVSPFPKGIVPAASDQAAPSRAFAKLVEAELRLGCRIQAGEACVDLGASPGSWTYTAVGRGARVTAVDRSPLRADLMSNRLVTFQRGDAFRFRPERSVDWLLCDVIASAEQTGALLTHWLTQGWCRRFVVTLKLKDTESEAVVARLKATLPALTGELFLARLCANKKEICAFGTANEPQAD
jgi:23S rRNA (cytidine2498-2'-O)-methyltransferase